MLKSFGTRIASFFRSMRLRVFLIVMVTGILTGLAFGITAYQVVKTASVRTRTDEVMDYADRLTRELETNVYTVNWALLTDISDDMDIVASMYSGRIIVTDSRLNIVYDSYALENGKTLVSAEAIEALQGNEKTYTDSEAMTVELSRPIGSEPVQGVLIIRFSTAESQELAEVLDLGLKLVAVIGILVLIVVALFFASSLTRPFGRITQSLHHISEGYTADRVDIGGFSELDRVSDSFNEMLSRINTLEESRQEFVSNVSHELKTPITSIKVLADSLINQPDAPIEMYREFMSDINSEVDRESKIISDLLALVKLDRKNGDMHIAEVNINELLELLLKRLHPIAQTADIELIYESYREVLAEVDEVKLSLALSNLIENGIKYNRPGGNVRVFLNADHRFFMIKVSDTGIGIPENELDRIFDRFYRVDKMRSRETGGTGLGLAITRSVVLMHHGLIRVESTEGEGTVFTVKIPLSYIKEAR